MHESISQNMHKIVACEICSNNIFQGSYLNGNSKEIEPLSQHIFYSILLECVLRNSEEINTEMNLPTLRLLICDKYRFAAMILLYW